MSTLYIGRLNWFEILSQSLQHSVDNLKSMLILSYRIYIYTNYFENQKLPASAIDKIDGIAIMRIIPQVLKAPERKQYGKESIRHYS